MSAQYREICSQRHSFLREHGLRDTNDCTVVGIAAVTGLTYGEAWELARRYGRKPGRGMYCLDMIRAIRSRGFRAEEAYPTRLINGLVLSDNKDFVRFQNENPGVRSKVKTMISAEQYLRKHHRGETWLLFSRSHVAVFNGVTIADWTAGRRHQVKWVFRITPIGGEA